MSTEQAASSDRASLDAWLYTIALGILAQVYAVVGAVAISGTLHGVVTLGGAGPMLAVLVVPVASVALSLVGILPRFPWWVWWLALPFWLSSLWSLSPLVLQHLGELDPENHWKYVKSALVAQVRVVVVGVVFGLSIAFQFSVEQGAEFVVLSIVPVYSLPVALFTSHVDFPATVWVLVVVLWYLALPSRG